MASTSTPDFSQLQAQQQLLRILEHPNYQLYSQRIMDLLKRLNLYTPETFRSLLQSEEIHRQTLSDLRTSTSQNPILVSDISEIQNFTLYRDLLKALAEDDWGQVRYLVSELGFAPSVSESLQFDPEFYQQTVHIMSAKLQQQTQGRPWLSYTPIKGKVPDVESFDDALTRYYVQNDFRKEFDDPGVKSLRYTALMSDPRAIATAEKVLGLEVTGDKTTFLTNYEHNYYTSTRCQDNLSTQCLELMAKTAPFETCYNAYLKYFLSRIRPNTERLSLYFATYGRFDVIEAVFTEILRQFQGIIYNGTIYNGTLSDACFDIAAVVAGKYNIDAYQKYFDRACQLVHPIMDRVDRNRLRDRLNNLLIGGIKSDDIQFLQRIISDIQTQFGDEYYSTNSINKSISTSAASTGNIYMMDRIKEISRFSLDAAVDAAIRWCNSDSIDYLESDMDRAYFSDETQLPVVADLVYQAAIDWECPKMFELCIRKTNASPETVKRLTSNIIGEPVIYNWLPESILEILLKYYIGIFSQGTLKGYLGSVVNQANVKKFEIIMKHPEFRVLTKPDLFFYQTSDEVISSGDDPKYNQSARYLMAKFLIEGGYVQISPDLKEEHYTALFHDYGTFKALVDYYLELGLDIDRDDFEQFKEIILSGDGGQVMTTSIREDLARLETLVVN